MSEVRARVLVVDDEVGMREMLTYDLTHERFEVRACADSASALSALQEQRYDVAVVDLMMPQMSGVDVLQRFKETDPDLEVIIMTGFATVETAIECLRRGAYDYIQKPYELDELRLVLTRAVEKKHLHSLVSLYEACCVFSATLEQHELVRTVLQVVSSILAIDAGVFALQRSPIGDVELFYTEGAVVSPELALAMHQKSLAAPGPVFQLQISEVNGTGNSEAFSSVSIHPLRIKNTQLGTLALLRATNRPAFTASELQRAMIFASQVAMALENTLLYEQLRAKAITDELTGVFSRSYLFQSLRQMLLRIGRKGPPVLSCLMIDLDYFKRINDTFGHLEGDRILRCMATTIRDAVRGTDIVARFGGEEFCVLLPETDLSGAQVVAEKIRATAERHGQHGITLSVGVATQHQPNLQQLLENPEEVIRLMNTLLNRADMALYEAKRLGRNQVICADAIPVDR